ncbi:uncharacterized protein A4U43_C03F30390 [Asparagus officinalis]|uniref:Uncharacterized protein n=1 Tax=Asparagus officinalis TaxID=4686 RepID=A0A5P1FE53_ASPOF|nr:uncharacterized protein A4U43_C03F30390 [Asparagus officinalis]
MTSPSPSVVRIYSASNEDGLRQAPSLRIRSSVLNSSSRLLRLSPTCSPRRGNVRHGGLCQRGLMKPRRCWFGAMPSAGAGGLAGSTGSAGGAGLRAVSGGSLSLALGLAFGELVREDTGRFPDRDLSGCCCCSRVELAMASRDMGNQEESFVSWSARRCADGVERRARSGRDRRCTLLSAEGVRWHRVLAFVGMQTGFGSTGRRKALRQTWFPSDPQSLRQLEESTGLAFRFVIGKTSDETKMETLKREVEEFRLTSCCCTTLRSSTTIYQPRPYRFSE